MRMSDVMDKAKGCGLTRSKEVRYVRLTFPSAQQASEFYTWCEDEDIATDPKASGDYVITVYTG